MAFDRSVSQMAREYEYLVRLYAAQPTLTQHFLDQQAGRMLSALEQTGGRIRFTLPDEIILDGGETLNLVPALRNRVVGRGIRRLARPEKCALLVRHLTQMEESLNPGFAVCGKLLRVALARMLVFHLVPDGRRVSYQPAAEGEIPSIPVEDERPAALLAPTDAKTVSEAADGDGGMLQVPYVAAARRFYLPQWVAFGDGDRLLAGTLEEGKAAIASLRKALGLLAEAEAICPSVVTDETYQRKRAGLLGQMVNQGRALARYQTRTIINKVRRRAEEGSLNRGLRINLPYFELEDLAIHLYPIEVIPEGRIMFVAAFVVRAMRLTRAKVRRDTQIGLAGRRQLLAQIDSIESAFLRHSPE